MHNDETLRPNNVIYDSDTHNTQLDDTHMDDSTTTVTDYEWIEEQTQGQQQHTL